MIPALVLTAGLGTRLRPLSSVRAKAALPVAGEPLVRRILRWLVAAGVRDAVLNLHHLPHTITSLVGDGSDLGVRIRYSWETPVLGSAGGPRHALPLLGPRFLIVNGDTLTNVDLEAVMKAHASAAALVTMALVPNTEPHKYGGVLVEGSGEGGIVRGFTRRGSNERSFHFIGVQVAEAEAFAALPDNTPHESVAALYPELMRARPGSIRAYVSDAEFLDIGTPADYLRTSLLMAAREGVSTVSGHARIAPDAALRNAVVWDDVVIGPGARVDDCIITDGVRIPAGTAWSGQTIHAADGGLAATPLAP
jgi:NDP-sugar pyrophosphorylase family protein